MVNKHAIVGFVLGVVVASTLVSFVLLPRTQQSSSALISVDDKHQSVVELTEQNHPSDRLVHNWTSLFNTPLTQQEAEWIEEVPVYDHAAQLAADNNLLQSFISSFFQMDDTPTRHFLTRVMLVADASVQEQAIKHWLSSKRQLDLDTAVFVVMYMQNQQIRIKLIIELIRNQQFSPQMQQYLFAHIRRDDELIKSAVLNPYIAEFIESTNDPILRAYALKTFNPQPAVSDEVFDYLIALTESEHSQICYQGMNVLNEWSYTFTNAFSIQQLAKMRQAANRVIANSAADISLRYKGLEWLENID
ncbi:hypothetical protein [Catenovulum agarivorans]|uniref:hypothetical protein n=1 Tax=Catenovulum agarivorans TaxID=1172192 RepID=UPI00031EEA0C|nr:hypothetical protein [Catenovulum agarivorans]